MNKLNKAQSGAVGPVEIVMILIIVGLVGLIGWRVYDARTDVSNRAFVSDEVVEFKPLPNDLSGIIDIDRLKTIVNDQTDGLSIVDLELKSEDGVLVYQVKLSDGSVLVINANDGSFIVKTEDDESDDENLPNLADLKIGFNDALKTALAEHEGGVRKIELELEDGVLVYSVRFIDGYRVDVNASNGSVIRTKDAKGESSRSNDDDSDDDNEAENEFEDDGEDDKRGSRQLSESDDDKEDDKQDDADDKDENEDEEDDEDEDEDEDDSEENDEEQEDN